MGLLMIFRSSQAFKHQQRIIKILLMRYMQELDKLKSILGLLS